MMKVVEVPTEGLAALLGQKVLLLCANYFYSGKLVGVNDSYVLLEDAGIVYETGSWSDRKWKDEQKLPKPVCVMKSAIEAWTEGK